MELFFRKYGEGEKSLIILHGFLGSSDNWATQAKLLAERYQVYAVDLRNHGQSPHSNEFTIHDMADDIFEFIQQHQIVGATIIGHSMGGKAAMQFAISHPDQLSKLIVVDIAPKAYPVHHDKIIAGLKSIPIDSIQSRQEADEHLSKYVAETGIRQFLLKNLSRYENGQFGWKMNLPVLETSLDKITVELEDIKKFTKPTRFIRGSKSNYVLDNDMNLIRSIFPNSELITIDAGHWVQAEKPQEFVEEVIRFVG